MKKTNSVLKEVLKYVKPSEAELKSLNLILNDFLKKLKLSIKKSRIKVEIFVGGSFAKKTMIKKDFYDADVFLRFDKKYNDEELSKMTSKILVGFDKKEVKGSRNYFQIELDENFIVEIIPVLNVKNPKEAKNITDLSYSHVKYVNKKMRNEKILNDVRLAKAFCHANKVYGAESYVKGFSGYGLELLILHYKSFLNFIKSAEKIKDKAVIDIEKQFRRKQDVLMDVNEAKLNSPIILIDPTCKNRNVLAALSYETFEKFRKISREFLKNPNAKFFETKTLDFDRERIKSKNKEFAVLELKTDKQTGDIAGTKLLKFFNHLAKEIEVYFKIKNKDFEYYNEDYGKGFFIAEKKKDVVKTGPFLKMKNEVQAFKKINKNTFVKKNRIYAKEKIDFSLREFLNNWAKKYSKIAKEMSIIEVKVY